jgi:galactoside O-acetyltransferase
MGLLTPSEIKSHGFAHVGHGVQVSDRASFYGCERITIGDHVRIDDFCVLSAGAGGIKLGRNIHLAVYTSLIGAGCITLSDFCNLSSRVSIYSSSDDFSGAAMTNPTVPSEFTLVEHKDVFLGRHVIVGPGSVILPGAYLDDGVAIGALSLVRGRCNPFTVYGGIPARVLKPRLRTLLDKEDQYMASRQNEVSR